MSKKKKANVVPRIGPPTNVRPAGAHRGRREEPRSTRVRRAIAESIEVAG